VPLNQEAKKRVSVLPRVIYPDCQGEIGLLLHNEDKEEFSEIPYHPLGCVLVLPCPVIKVNGKLQANSDKTMNDPDTSEMKI
jgi:hypothetical protein